MPYRPRAFLLALATLLPLLLGGCLQSDQALIAEDGRSLLTQGDAQFLTACRDKTCALYWSNRLANGRIVGGQVNQRDIRSVAILQLPGNSDAIAQFTQRTPARNYYQYALLRQRPTGYDFYDIDLHALSPDYIAALERDGFVKPASRNDLSKTKDYKVANRDGLLRIATDLSQLDDAALARVAEPRQVSLTTQTFARQQIGQAMASLSRATLENQPAPAAAPPQAARKGAPGCPTGLPDTITCTAYPTAPIDPIPRLGISEILHFQRGDCVHCKQSDSLVAAWQLALPPSMAYQRANANWDDPLVAVYGMKRVPAFVVNRKYRVELSSSDIDVVQQALALVRALAAETAGR